MAKTAKFLIFSFSSLLIFLSSCSNIDEDERLIYDPVNIDVPEGGVARHVLIEDFTGQKCANCPTATQVIEQIGREFPEAIIPVAIHSGDLGVLPTAEEPYGLATELGNEYYRHWGIDMQPLGVIDRSDGKLNHPLWMAKVKKDLQDRPLAPIDIRIGFNDEQTAVSIDVVAVKDSAAQGHIQAWLTEDSITALQYMPDGSKNNSYLHQHVLRTSLNGSWGDDVSVSNANSQQSFSYDLPANTEWKKEHLAVVAFVYNDAGVVQVARKYLVDQASAPIPEEPKDTIPTDTIPQDTIPNDTIPQDTIPEVIDYDTTFMFVDANGNQVKNGQTVVITKLEDGQMNTNLSILNTTDEDAAGVMRCDITAMPNGTFTSCAFGQCLSPWNAPGEYDSYKSIIKAGTPAQPILTEWVPDAYGEWECTFQLCTLNIVSQTMFGIVTQKAGEEIIGEGPKITIRFVYDSTSAQP